MTGWLRSRCGLVLATVAACSGPPASSPTRPEAAPTKAHEGNDAEVEADVDGEPATAAEAGAEGSDDAATSPEPPQTVADTEPVVVEDPWLRGLMEARPRKFATLLADPARFRMQVLVTVIPADTNKGAAAVEHGYRVDAEYVYPASAIKTFAAVGALLVLDDLRDQGRRVGLHTPLAYCEGDSQKCTTDHDESNLDGGTITVGHEIRKMQLVSNNVSFNRLYELVGHRELNEGMWALGFPSLRVQHRMYGVRDPFLQRHTPRVELRPSKGKPVVIEAKQSDLEMPPLGFSQMALGVGYIDDETNARVDEPLDFRTKNYVSIRDLHRLTLAIARPGLPGVPQLELRKAHRQWLIESMEDNPSETVNPAYPKEKNGLRYKTMIGGMQRVMPLSRIRYMCKAGRAYGFHLDNAYIEDRKTGRAMAVTVVIYANANGVLNDNAYEYDGVTRPFLKNLGEVLAQAVFIDETGS